MATVEPLSPTEDALWRAVMRIVKVIPRHLDSDLIRGTGLTASEYTTIMHLSEAPNRELRMADLASATDLSASRMSRLVDTLQSQGLVTKTASSSDARGNVARLTSSGHGQTAIRMADSPCERSSPLLRPHRPSSG